MKRLMLFLSIILVSFSLTMANGYTIKIDDNIKQEEVIKIINEDGVNEVYECGNTVLSAAAKGNRPDLVKLILKYKPEDIESSLVIAIENKNYNIVNLLLNKKINVNIATSYGEPITVRLFRDKQKKLVKKLILKGANINMKDYDNIDLLSLASKDGDYEMANYLLKKGAKNLDLAMDYATDKNQPKIVKLLIKYGADINRLDKYNKNYLYNAVMRRDNELVKIFANTNIKNKNTALNIAIYNNMDYAFSQLIKDKKIIDKPYDGYIPIFYSIYGGKKDYVKKLIEAGANIELRDDKNNYTPLFYAIYHHQHDIAEMLIKKGANKKIKVKNTELFIVYNEKSKNYEIKQNGDK